MISGKMVLKEQLNIPEITDNPYHGKLLISAFPQVLQDRFASQMEEHPLRAEIIATKLANNMVNDMGCNFLFRMREETGATVHEIANAYAVVRGVFGVEELWSKVEALDNKIPADTQLAMFDSIRRTLRQRWYMRHGKKGQALHLALIVMPPLSKTSRLENYLVPAEFKQLKAAAKVYTDKGVPEALSQPIASLGNVFSVLIWQKLWQNKKNVANCRFVFLVRIRLELHWFLDQINRKAVSNHWQALARSSYREELDGNSVCCC